MECPLEELIVTSAGDCDTYCIHPLTTENFRETDPGVLSEMQFSGLVPNGTLSL